MSKNSVKNNKNSSDFAENNANIDASVEIDSKKMQNSEVFAENNQLDNYASFLYKMKEQVELTEYEDQVLSFVTKELVNGMRKHELLLLKMERWLPKKKDTINIILYMISLKKISNKK